MPMAQVFLLQEKTVGAVQVADGPGGFGQQVKGLRRVVGVDEFDGLSC